jgi:hypothetical protein
LVFYAKLSKVKPMTPLDRVLRVTAALWGIGVFAFALRAASNPMGPPPGWALHVGVICLIVGLTTGSLVTWCGSWR